jgi:hypothetical protein
VEDRGGFKIENLKWIEMLGKNFEEIARSL